jgi:basic membrane protein A
VQRRWVRLAAIAAGVAIVVAAGLFALVHAVGGASAAPLTGCEITTSRQLTDRSFNQAVYYGLTDASTKWSVGVHDKVSGTRGQWLRNMDSLVHQRCGLIVTIGSVAGSDTVAAAKANPHTYFASTDAANVRPSSNLMSIQFRPNQGAFVAGYLAAGLTKTGKVGTFGGLPIRTVTGFMDGFWAGVQHYNQVHGTHVRVLGWNPKTRQGLFVSRRHDDFGAFSDPVLAHDLAGNLIHSGADVILPADGPVGESSSCRAALRTRHVLLIGADEDQFYATPACQARWVTSVMKIYRRMVYLAMGQVVHGQFRGGNLWGTLKNGGVALAPPHTLKSRIPAGLLAEVVRVRQDIISRSVSTDSRSYLSG